MHMHEEGLCAVKGVKEPPHYPPQAYAFMAILIVVRVLFASGSV